MILRDSAQSVRTQKDAGNRTARWQAPSSGSRSTRTPRAQDRARDGRRQIEIAGVRIHGMTEGVLHEAESESVEGNIAAIVGGRAERDEEIGVEVTAAVDGRDVRVARATARPGATGTSERHDRSDRISKGCPEPEPWARRITVKRRVQAAGMPRGVRLPAELSKLRRVMAMQSPRVRVATLLQDATLPVR